jgi:predicted DNA-binding transcriptional regulator YafY
MYHSSTRLLTILELLQARERVSGPELAARLEVSPRSVRRYITMLQDMGIPVEGERGRYGRYRLRPGYKLPPLMFSDDEAVALTVGLLLLRRSGGLVEPSTAERTLAKLTRVLPEGLRGQVTALQETLVLEVPPEQALPGSEQLTILSQGVWARRRVWLRYLNEQQSASERDFDPYGVVQRGGRWYAAGYCHLRQALRVFRVDRIDEAKLLDPSFELPKGFDAPEYVSRSVALVPLAHSAEVLLKTNLENAKRELYPNFVTLEPASEGVTLRCTTDNLTWLARVIAGFSFPWEVREPPELEVALREHAAGILERLGG